MYMHEYAFTKLLAPVFVSDYFDLGLPAYFLEDQSYLI